MASFTRDDIVTVGQAVEEFRDESSGPHHAANRELAERVRSVLRGPGDQFTLAAGDGSTEVAVRALREIAQVRGQQGSEAKRMAKSALLAMGEDVPE